jgi:hypothetical protein
VCERERKEEKEKERDWESKIVCVRERGRVNEVNVRKKTERGK